MSKPMTDRPDWNRVDSAYWRQWFEGCQEARASADATITALRETLENLEVASRGLGPMSLDTACRHATAVLANSEPAAQEAEARIVAPWREVLTEILPLLGAANVAYNSPTKEHRAVKSIVAWFIDKGDELLALLGGEPGALRGCGKSKP